jgi:hypothetical protein
LHKQPTLIALAAIAVFLPALWAGFAADDFTLLLTAHGVHWPLGPLARNDLGEAGGAGHFYRPLWVLFNGGAVAVFGDRGAWLHLLNVGLYALTCVEVFYLARSFVGRRAWIAGLAFALYPRHVESVAWLSGNTDLLATALVLGAVLCALSTAAESRRLTGAVLLTVLAALTKEIGFLTPLLAALALYGLRRDRREMILAPAAMAVALIGVFIARTIAIGGLGGYGDDPVTVVRVAGAAASYAIAAVTPHQLELLVRPWLVVIPLALVLAAAWRARMLWREAHAVTGWKARASLRVAATGLAWFAIALLPVLGQLLDLNNATGERLMFLPSVGLALAFAALVPARASRATAAALATLALAAAGLTAFGAAQWVTATDIAENSVEAVAKIAPRNGELVLLTFPESYRNAHVFTNGLDRALLRAGRGDVLLSFCVPVHIRDRRADQVAFSQHGRAWSLTTTRAAPFDVPVVGSASSLSPGCSITGGGDKIAPGLERRATARPLPRRRRVDYAYFDGRDWLLVLPGKPQLGLD